MALEVVWVRLLTPYLGTVVYAFALILTIYLLATFLGSAAYRSGSLSRGLDLGCSRMPRAAWRSPPRIGGWEIPGTGADHRSRGRSWPSGRFRSPSAF